MSEEEIFVGPFAGGESTVENEVADVGLFTTEVAWFVHGVELEQGGISWDLLDDIDEVQGLILVFDLVFHDLGLIFEEFGLEIIVDLPSEREWELWVGGLAAILSILGEIGETDIHWVWGLGS